MAEPQYLSTDPAAGDALPQGHPASMSDTTPNEVDPNTLGTFVKHLWAGVNPVQIGQMLPFPKVLGGSGMDNPLFPQNIVKSLQAVKQQADEALAKGNEPGPHRLREGYYIRALTHYVESVIPILGPMMARQGDELQGRKYMAAGGDMTAMAASAAVAPKAIGAAGAAADAVGTAASKVGRAAIGTVDALDPDLVSIASPRAGSALKVAQKVKAVLDARGAPAEPAATPVPTSVPPPGTSPAAAAPAAPVAPTVAPPETAPAGSAPAPGTAPGAGASAMWQTLRQAGLKPTEAIEAYRLLSQGMAPEAVQAKILAARPSAASVAPETPAAPVAMSPARTLNELAIAARRAKVKLSQEDYQALIPLVQQGATPAEAVAKLPALQLQRITGTMTDAQVAAEIAARKNNRSPQR